MSEGLRSEWPSHWATATINELTPLLTSGSRDWKPHYHRGKGVFILTQNVRMLELDLSDPFLVDPPSDDPARARSAVEIGDLLINIVGDVGAVARIRVPMPEHYVCQSVALLRPALIELSPFLELYIAAPDGGQAYFKSKAYGIGRGHLSFADIKAMPVPIPPPDEQQRIVAEVERLRAMVRAGTASLDDAEKLLRTQRDAILKSAFAGELISTPVESGAPLLPDLTSRRRLLWEQSEKRPYKEPAGPAEPLPDAPRGWAIASLEQLTDPKRVICYGILKPKVSGGGVVPYVEVRDIRRGELDRTKLNRTSRDLHEEFSRSTLKAGDVLLAIRGSYDCAAVVPETVAGANISRDVARIAPLPDVDPAYVTLYLESSSAQRYLRLKARGVAVKGVNIGHLREMPVPLPSFEMQQAIVAVATKQLEALEEVRLAIARGRAQARALERAIFQCAIRGDLVEPGQAKDAAALLDAVRVARIERIAEMKLRKRPRVVQAVS